MIRLHTVARCVSKDCPWEADGPRADAQAAKHSDAKGPAHATVTSTHPTTRCHQEGCHR